MPTRPRYRCRFCGALLPAWLPVAKQPETSMRRDHMSPPRRVTSVRA